MKFSKERKKNPSMNCDCKADTNNIHKCEWIIMTGKILKLVQNVAGSSGFGKSGILVF